MDATQCDVCEGYSPLAGSSRPWLQIKVRGGQRYLGGTALAKSVIDVCSLDCLHNIPRAWTPSLVEKPLRTP